MKHKIDNIKHNVLIVEDELLIAWDIKYILEESNLNAIIAKDFNSAIDQINTKMPDLVIIDVFLGKGKNGIDLGFYLSNEYKLPFIYLTSQNERKTIDEIILTRPYGFITKPFKKVDLITSIKIALNSFRNKYKF